MQQRHLGSNGPDVSAIGFGAMSFAGWYGEADDAESEATLDHAIRLGVNFIDTADTYGQGRSEEVVGRVLRRHRRDSVVVATKFGGGGRDGLGRRDNVRPSCEASLRRLATDHIDLYYLHRVDPTTPIEETVSAMAELVRAGLVRWIGLSEASTATIRRAHAVYPFAALQTEYSLFSRDVEDAILPTVRELGIGFVAYSPLGRGLLSGAVASQDQLAESDWRRTHPRFQPDTLARNAETLAALQSIAERVGCTLPQLALSWLLHQANDIVPIPGTRRRSNIEANAAAAAIRLSEDDLRDIDDVAAPDRVAGERGSADYLARVNR